MIYSIEQTLIDIFLNKGEHDSKHISALNVCLHHILQQPYFENGYSNHTLVQQADDFFTLKYRLAQHRELHNADPLKNMYDDGYEDEDTDLIARPKSTHAPLEVSSSNIPSDIQQLADQYLKDFQSLSEFSSIIFDATPQTIQDRHNITITKVSASDIMDLLHSVLGEAYNYIVLHRENISYHEHKWDSNFEYIVAHNKHEIAGILGYISKNDNHGLSYVSVSPAFRQHGLSQQMYQHFIDTTIQQKKILIRSSPSPFTLDNPNITKSYDTMLKNSDVLHAISGTYMEGALTHILKDNNYDDMFAAAKPLCDQLIDIKRASTSSYQFENEDRQISQNLRSLFEPEKTSKMKL